MKPAEGPPPRALRPGQGGYVPDEKSAKFLSEDAYAEVKQALIQSVRAYNCRTHTGKVVVEFEVCHPSPRLALESMLKSLPRSPEGTMKYGIRSMRFLDE